MLGHPIRNTVLILVAVVLSTLTIYGLWLYSQSLNSAYAGRSQTFWQLLQSDLKHKRSLLNQSTKR